MPILWRRISINCFSDSPRTSSPSIITSPAVGSTSRDRQRTMVDFPDPERPMMTKISPSRTSNVTSHAAGMCDRSTISVISAAGSATSPSRPEKKPSASSP